MSITSGSKTVTLSFRLSHNASPINSQSRKIHSVTKSQIITKLHGNASKNRRDIRRISAIFCDAPIH